MFGGAAEDAQKVAGHGTVGGVGAAGDQVGFAGAALADEEAGQLAQGGGVLFFEGEGAAEVGFAVGDVADSQVGQGQLGPDFGFVRGDGHLFLEDLEGLAGFAAVQEDAGEAEAGAGVGGVGVEDGAVGGLGAGELAGLASQGAQVEQGDGAVGVLDEGALVAGQGAGLAAELGEGDAHVDDGAAPARVQVRRAFEGEQCLLGLALAAELDSLEIVSAGQPGVDGLDDGGAGLGDVGEAVAGGLDDQAGLGAAAFFEEQLAAHDLEAQVARGAGLGDVQDLVGLEEALEPDAEAARQAGGGTGHAAVPVPGDAEQRLGLGETLLTQALAAQREADLGLAGAAAISADEVALGFLVTARFQAPQAAGQLDAPHVAKSRDAARPRGAEARVEFVCAPGECHCVALTGSRPPRVEGKLAQAVFGVKVTLAAFAGRVSGISGGRLRIDAPAEGAYLGAVPRLRLLGVLLAFLMAGAGCDKVSHDNIEKWRGTQQGPDKLADALGDDGVEPALRAHAAQALVALGESDKVIEAVALMDAEPKQLVLSELVTRLWEDARIADPMQVPTQRQLAAKDMMFTLRPQADGELRERIDGYLLDWLGGNYERRASMGNVEGEAIVRAIGPEAAPKVIAAARDILKRPPVGNRYEPLGDSMLKTLAAVGDPAAIGLLIDLGSTPNENDDTLQVRAMSAIDYAYSDEANLEPPPPPAAIKPHVDRLVPMAQGVGNVPAANINFAYEVIGHAGPPECVEAATKLAASPEEAPRYAALRVGIQCGGPDALVPLMEAVPKNVGYPQAILEKYVVVPVLDGNDRKQVAAAARKLLESDSWVAQYLGVELLARVGTKADAERLGALAGSKQRLTQFWGDSAKDPEVRKKGREPVLGARAEDVAKTLENRP